MKKLLLGLSLLVIATQANALSLDWSGGYRVEYTEVDRPTLGDPSGHKGYGQHLLYLTPTIVPADGYLINTRIDVLSNNDPMYRNSQMGTFFGGASIPTGQNGEGNVYRQDMGSSPVQVSQLYLTFSDELATLKVGRQPYQFGLGITYNAGAGAFDHWYDTYDMLSYKVNVGSLSLTPMFGQLYQAGASLANKYQVQMVELKYENTDSGSLLGALWERKAASQTLVKDDPATDAAFYGGTPGTPLGDFNSVQTSFVLGRDWTEFGLKLEGSVLQGNTGIEIAKNTFVRLNSYAIASEFEYRPENSKWNTKLRAGIASGDDPTTLDSFEGFIFDRNYDVAFLLFNQRLGNPNTDFFRTNIIKDTTGGVNSYYAAADDEAISNTTYISPRISYAWNDKLDVVNTLTYAQMMNATSPTTVDMSKELGIEWDIELVYKPRDKVRWINQIGWLSPGSAWSNGSSNFKNESTYGFASKAAISF